MYPSKRATSQVLHIPSYVSSQGSAWLVFGFRPIMAAAARKYEPYDGQFFGRFGPGECAALHDNSSQMHVVTRI